MTGSAWTRDFVLRAETTAISERWCNYYAATLFGQKSNRFYRLFHFKILYGFRSHFQSLILSLKSIQRAIVLASDFWFWKPMRGLIKFSPYADRSQKAVPKWFATWAGSVIDVSVRSGEFYRVVWYRCAQLLSRCNGFWLRNDRRWRLH